jgi:hypothetical protein
MSPANKNKKGKQGSEGADPEETSKIVEVSVIFSS